MAEPTAFTLHDHNRCQQTALRRAEAVCEERRLRLTPVRRRVLEILLEDHKALGAYEVLRRLTGEGATPQPPVAYRALDFLVANGFAHRIERLNAYVACCDFDDRHQSAFLICRACHGVAEVDAGQSAKALGTAVSRVGFAADTAVIEVEGICAGCQRVAETAS